MRLSFFACVIAITLWVPTLGMAAGTDLRDPVWRVCTKQLRPPLVHLTWVAARTGIMIPKRESASVRRIFENSRLAPIGFFSEASPQDRPCHARRCR
jgi:hypothetical protein